MLLSRRLDGYNTYSEMIRNLSPTTIYYNNFVLSRFIDFVGDSDVNDLQYGAIEAWMVAQVDYGYKPGSINTERTSLRAFLRYCTANGDVLHFDIAFIHHMKCQERKITVVEPKTVARVASGLDDERLKLAILLMFEAGLRIGEVVKLRKDDVSGRELCVHDTKSGRVRLAFISQRTADELVCFMGRLQTDRVFAYGNCFKSRSYERYHTNGLRKAVGLAFKKEGYKVNPHLLRHSFATALMKNGCDLFSVKELLGHSDIRTTQRYLHLSDPELKEKYDKYAVNVY